MDYSTVHMNILFTILEGFHGSFTPKTNQTASSLWSLTFALLTHELVDVLGEDGQSGLKVITTFVDSDMAAGAKKYIDALIDGFGGNSVEGDEADIAVAF